MALNYLRQYATQPVAEPVSDAARVPSRIVALEEVLDGVNVSHGSGSCFVAGNVHDREHYHGMLALKHLSGVTASQLSVICHDPELAYADLSRAVFLDTETTGLGLGAGTYVFLVGAGYMDGGCFRVKQFFLRSPGEEEALLLALQAFLQEFSMLVTFNGKAFDWPLLESRFVRHRSFRRAPLNDPPHIDLLHPARRLWKRRLPSCSLSSLETEILGVSRTGQDVPGWMIPSLYFQYLRTGDASGLEGIFYHNLQDILSLATLAIHIDRVMADPMAGLVNHGSDFYSIGKTYERSDDFTLATACYDEALRRDLSPDLRRECLYRLGGVHKRQRRWEPALAAWDRLIDEGGAASLQGLIERAKYHEHVEREYLDALDDVQQALQLLDISPILAAGTDRRDLEHRQARLVNRVYRNRSWVS